MLSINTNLSSLIAQGSMKSSTNKLNQAIERMTTGFKINHAKDNAANYQISNQMTTKINSLQVAEDNTAMGLDMVTQASEILDELNNRVQRLRDLQEQANNSTYGEQSLKAINSEVNALVDEINRLYDTAEYNGITLFMESTTLADGSVVVQKESDAQLTTTFKELGISATNFEIYDSNDNLIQSYDIEENDTINDFFTTLQAHGFTTKLTNGEITIKSSDLAYIAGDLADELGISTKNDVEVSCKSLTTTISSTELVTLKTEGTTVSVKYSNQLLVDGETVTADTTMAELGLLSGENWFVYVQDGGYKDGANSTILTLATTSTLGEVVELWNSCVGSMGYCELDDGVLYCNQFDESYYFMSYFMYFSTSLDDSNNFFANVVQLHYDSGYNIDEILTEVTQEIRITTIVSTTTVGTTQTSSKQTFIQNPVNIYAPGTINLMIGTTAEADSNLNVGISFDLEDISEFRGIGIDGVDYLASIDKLLNRISAKQTEFGAVSNRLESVLEEITIQRDNLVSSRSTIRDADIAEVSSHYIQQQILQQASATLLATANQSPSIALQLI